MEWWKTTDIVNSFANSVNAQINKGIDAYTKKYKEIMTQHAENVEQAKAKAQRIFKAQACAKRAANAEDRLRRANENLLELGFTDQIPITQANIDREISGGFASDVIQQALTGSYQAREKELRKAAEHDVKLVTPNWNKLTYEEQQDLIEQNYQVKFRALYPEGRYSLSDPGSFPYQYSVDKLVEGGYMEAPSVQGEPVTSIEEWYPNAVISEQGVEIENGLMLMPDYSVVSGNETIGRIDPKTGDFIEKELAWWEKLRNVVSWLPPNIPATLIQKYGFAVIEKADVPFMIQDHALELNKRGNLTAEESAFMDLYKEEVGEPPTGNLLLSIIHQPINIIKTWASADLSPSEELKTAYYESTGIGSRILHGVATPLSVALFVAGGLGGATGAQSKLGTMAAKPGVTGVVGKAGQMATAPLVGYEWVIGNVISRTVGGTYRVVMTSVLKRNLRSWAKSVGIEIPKATEDNFIREALRNLKPSFMTKEALRTLFKPVKGGQTITQAGATAAEQASAQAVRSSPLLLGLTKPTTTGVGGVPATTMPVQAGGAMAVSPTAGAAPIIATTGEVFTSTVYRGATLAPTDEGLVGKAQYWTTDQQYAATYGTVTESQVTLNNPLVINTQGEWNEFALRTRELRDTAVEQGRDEGWVQAELRTQLEKEGYDGVVIAEGIVEKGKQIAVFHPEEAVKEAAPTAMVEGRAVSEKTEEIPVNAMTEAENLLTKIGDEWVAGRPGIGLTNNQIARAKAGIATIAKKYGIDKNILWKNVWWEAEVKPEIVEAPLTEEQIGELIKTVITPLAKPTATVGEITAIHKVAPETTALAEGTISGEIPEGTVEVTGLAMSPQELASIRQNIIAVGKVKGLSKTALNDMFRQIAGRTPDNRQMPWRLTEMTDEQLRDTLEIIRTARPIRIGQKIVIKPSTEKKILSLKQSLINESKLSEEAFDNMVEQLNLPTTRYETAQRFITEKEGKSLIRLMNDEAEIGLIEHQAQVDRALATSPKIKTAIDGIDKGIAQKGAPYIEGLPPDLHWKTEMLKDMRFFTEDLQIRTSKPFYDVYFGLNRQHLANDAYIGEVFDKIAISTPEYNNIRNNKAAMTRVRNWIAAKQKWTNVKSPKDITPEETKLARAYEKALWAEVPDFKYHRFLHHYEATEGDVHKMVEHYKDAPIEELRMAVNTYERQGATALRNYLDTKDWGIIGSGYEPHYVVSPQLAMRRLKATFATRRLEPRTGVEFYPEDITIDHAVRRYIAQVRNYNLQPYVRKLNQLYGEALPQFKNPQRINQALTGMMREMLGYKDRSFLGELAMKVASQAYIVIFGTSIDLPFRNIFQNLSYATHKTAIIDPRNEKLPDYNKHWYQVNTTQMGAIKRHQLLAEEGGLPPFRRANRAVLRLNLYGLSDDKVNRLPHFWGMWNKANRALTNYQEDGDVGKFMKDSGMNEMTMTQQKQVLELLALDNVNYDVVGTTDGGTAATLEIANEVTNNVHFLYDRAQRAAIEHSEGGRIIGSLSIFSRSVGQRVVKQINVLRPNSGASSASKKAALKVLYSMLWGSLAANYLYQKATGKTRAPYNPLNLLTWQAGGLALGAIQQLTEVSGLMFMAMGGNDWAKTQLPITITQAGDTFVPWYKSAMRLIEVMVEKKHLDRLLARELISIIDKTMVEMGFLDEAYQPNESYYEAERSGEWMLKHALFGTDPDEEVARKATAKDMYAKAWGYESWADLPEGNANTAGTRAHFNSLNS